MTRIQHDMQVATGYSATLYSDGRNTWEINSLRHKRLELGPALGLCANFDNYGVLRQDHSLWLWGANKGGKLGFDGPAGKPRPVELPPIVKVSMGPDHTVALDEDGNVWCAGNVKETHGVGATGFRVIFEHATDIAANGYGIMVVDENRSVFALGETSTGSLGLGARGDVGYYVAEFVDTGAKADSIIQVGKRTWLLSDDGTVSVTGDSRDAPGKRSDGQVPDGYRFHTVECAPITAIAGARDHTLLVDSDAQTWFVGKAYWGWHTSQNHLTNLACIPRVDTGLGQRVDAVRATSAGLFAHSELGWQALFVSQPQLALCGKKQPEAQVLCQPEHLTLVRGMVADRVGWNDAMKAAASCAPTYV